MTKQGSRCLILGTLRRLLSEIEPIARVLSLRPKRMKAWKVGFTLAAALTAFVAVVHAQRPFRVYQPLEGYDDIPLPRRLSGTGRVGLWPADVSASPRVHVHAPLLSRRTA